MLHFRANDSLLSFMTLLMQTGTLALSILGMGNGHRLPELLPSTSHPCGYCVTARSTSSSSVEPVSQVTKAVIHHLTSLPVQWPLCHSCLAASARRSSLLCTSCTGRYPLVGLLSYTPLHWKVSPCRTSLLYTSCTGRYPLVGLLSYTSCTGRYHLLSSASPMDAFLASVDRYSTQTERYKHKQSITYAHTCLEPALSESLMALCIPSPGPYAKGPSMQTSMDICGSRCEPRF